MEKMGVNHSFNQVGVKRTPKSGWVDQREWDGGSFLGLGRLGTVIKRGEAMNVSGKTDDTSREGRTTELVERNPGEGSRWAIKSLSTWMKDVGRRMMLVSEKEGDSLDGQSGKC